MLFAAVLQLMLLFQDDVPYKPEEEFSIKFQYAFMKRGDAKNDDFILSQTASTPLDKLERGDNSPLPHLTATLEVFKKDSLEVKLRIVRDNSMQALKQKIELNEKLTVFAGFIDDIQDQISGYQHTVYFLNKQGTRLHKIVIEFDEEGFYYVNGKKKGKV